MRLIQQQSRSSNLCVPGDFGVNRARVGTCLISGAACRPTGAIIERVQSIQTRMAVIACVRRSVSRQRDRANNDDDVDRLLRRPHSSSDVGHTNTHDGRTDPFMILTDHTWRSSGDRRFGHLDEIGQGKVTGVGYGDIVQ